jgi:hypothetical protein
MYVCTYVSVPEIYVTATLSIYLNIWFF